MLRNADHFNRLVVLISYELREQQTFLSSANMNIDLWKRIITQIWSIAFKAQEREQNIPPPTIIDKKRLESSKIVCYRRMQRVN